MPIGLLVSNPLVFFIWAGALLLSLTIHEFAHAFVAEKLGDPTPRIQGRISLNPLAHLDPVGTLALLFVGFGWGKPVEFDPYNLKHPKQDAGIIAAAGPISNLLLATVIALLIRFVPLPEFVAQAFAFVVATNVGLAIFNLIPIHPLDGGKILIALAPKDIAREWDAILHQYGSIILLFLIVPWNGSSAVSTLISPVITYILRFLL